MSLCAVGFGPCAPLLVPAVAGGSAHLDADLRAAALTAVHRLVAASPTEIVVLAPTAPAGTWPASAAWDFSGFGVPQPDRTEARLPWSLGIGAWLLDECGWRGSRRYIGAGGDQPAAGADLGSTASHQRTAVLALGDGSACRTERAPGYLDPRAEQFDASIASALARGDAAGLAAIDGGLARELLCAGLPVWRWIGSRLGGRAVTAASLDVDAAPYGVAYFVASWTIA